MPLWLIHHSSNTLANEDKEVLAKQITQMYIRYGLPAFYVHVQFTEMSPSCAFVGGEKSTKQITLAINHVARNLTSEAQAQRVLSDIDAILTPFFEPRGLNWEYFVTESSRDLWKINGLVPPQPGSDEEKEWCRLNKAFKL